MEFIALDDEGEFTDEMKRSIESLARKLQNKYYKFSNNLIGVEMNTIIKIKYYLQLLKAFNIKIMFENDNIYNGLKIEEKKSPIDLEEYYHLITRQIKNVEISLRLFEDKPAIMINYETPFKKIIVINSVLNAVIIIC